VAARSSRVAAANGVSRWVAAFVAALSLAGSTRADEPPAASASPAARAEEAPAPPGPAAVRITGSRVFLKDVMPECPEQACLVDLGAAPPAGSTRLVPADAIRSALGTAGASARKIEAVRVLSAARVWSPAELGELVRPNIEHKLPEGVRLLALQPKTGVTLPLLASVGECTLPALAKRAGPLTTTAMVEFLHDGAPVRRVAVQVRLNVSERAARPGVARGSIVTLVIQRSSATVSANGVALQDSEIGQTASFKVQPTGRIVMARIESASLAMVLEQP
jgi:hypothetical protein